MTGPNWQADMMNRLDDDSAAAGETAPAAADATPPPGNPVEEPVAPVPPPAAPVAPAVVEPTMPPPPPPSGAGWGAPVPPQQQQPPYEPQNQPQYQQQSPQYQGQPYQQPQYQQPQYPQPGYQQPQYQQPQYEQPEQPPQYQQPYPQEQYPQQPYNPEYEQQQYNQAPPYQQQPQYDQGYQQQQPPPYDPAQYGPPGQYNQPQQYPEYNQPQQYPEYQQPPAQQPPVQQPPVPPYEQQQPYAPQPMQQGPPQQYGPPAENYDPQYDQSQGWNGPPPQQGATGWDNPAPDGGPDSHAYTPAYHDPLGEPLPVATGSVGLQHEEERPGAGGFLRRIGRFAAEAAYIAGASGRMQRDVENIALIRRPIGIGRMIGVIGPVPQSGTSTVTALLADTLAGQRTDIVLAVDACPQEGKLTHRLDQGIANTPNSRVQLARAEPTADAISEVLAARNVGGANQIPLSLVDCPAGLFEEATGYVAGAAHAVALVIPSSRDAALNSIDQLDRLTTDGQHMLVDKGLVIIAEIHPDDPEPVQWLQSAVSDRGLGYVVLPYDEHLARAWPLRPEALEPATRRAALELAARLVERATR